MAQARSHIRNNSLAPNAVHLSLSCYNTHTSQYNEFTSSSATFGHYRTHLQRNMPTNWEQPPTGTKYNIQTGSTFMMTTPTIQNTKITTSDVTRDKSYSWLYLPTRGHAYIITRLQNHNNIPTGIEQKAWFLGPHPQITQRRLKATVKFHCDHAYK